MPVQIQIITYEFCTNAYGTRFTFHISPTWVPTKPKSTVPTGPQTLNFKPQSTSDSSQEQHPSGNQPFLHLP